MLSGYVTGDDMAGFILGKNFPGKLISQRLDAFSRKFDSTFPFGFGGTSKLLTLLLLTEEGVGGKGGKIS